MPIESTPAHNILLELAKEARRSISGISLDCNIGEPWNGVPPYYRFISYHRIGPWRLTAEEALLDFLAKEDKNFLEKG
jgi:hypothetical protein